MLADENIMTCCHIKKILILYFHITVDRMEGAKKSSHATVPLRKNEICRKNTMLGRKFNV
jgi:hypothetical protein